MKKFDNNIEFLNFLADRMLRKEGSGSEGTFYYSRNEKKGYKLFDEPTKYDVSKIIMESEVCLDSFIFPEELLMVNDEFKGYTSRIIRNNIFSNERVDMIDPGSIDFENLKNAYKLMKIDTARLSEKGIAVFDLPGNIVYDGKRFYAIDTCSYYKSNDKNLLRYNINCLDDAIDIIFMLELGFAFDEIDIKSREELSISVLKYIDYVAKKVNRYKKNQEKEILQYYRRA